MGTGFLQPATWARAANTPRQWALASLMSPILLMASLVSTSILLMSDLGRTSGIFGFWLSAHLLVSANLFLTSLRDMPSLLEGRPDNQPAVAGRVPMVLLGCLWGLVPGVLILIQPMRSYLGFGGLLASASMVAAVLLRVMPGLSKILVTCVLTGFVAYFFLVPDRQSAGITLMMLGYFGVFAVCSRWYYARFEQRLIEAEAGTRQAEALNGVLMEIGTAAETFFWRTGPDGAVIGPWYPGILPGADGMTPAGCEFISLFAPSPERDILKLRMARQTEIVALELRVAGEAGSAAQWWRISALPILRNQIFEGYRGAAGDITQLRASEERAAFLSAYDDLTGLLNRGSFYAAVETLLQNRPVATHQAGILWIDLDSFKWVNDTFGHAGGDEILKAVALRLQAACQPGDTICRFGGDEFAILATRETDGDGLQAFVETLTHRLATPYALTGADVQCSASVGFKRILPGETDAASLMQEADLALYSAKTGGRATWMEYSDAFKARVRGQRELARDLEGAIARDELTLDFQPIIGRDTGTMVGVEALSRWLHPFRGAVSPSEFIRVAESNGLILSLGDVVIAKAIEEAARLPVHLRVAVNISPLQLHSNALLPLIEDSLRDTGVDPARIELEITETVFLSDNAFVLGRLRDIKKLGIRISLDDFGTGFSSLAYLQRFPFDKLKLDQTFVSGIESSDQSCAIARATISMAHALGLTVTAEGIETQAQADFLLEQGCDELQGFLFSRPLDAAELQLFCLKSMAGPDRAAMFDSAKVVLLPRR